MLFWLLIAAAACGDVPVAGSKKQGNWQNQNRIALAKDHLTKRLKI